MKNLRPDRGHPSRRATPFRALAATAAVSALLLSACSSDDPDVEDPTTSDSAETEGPTDPALATHGPTSEEDATTEAPEGSGDAPNGRSGMPGESGIDWDNCDAPWETTDHVGNQFVVTVCSLGGDVASFYEFDSSQHAGMVAEYTELTHVADTWAVAASSEALLDEIVSKLESANQSAVPSGAITSDDGAFEVTPPDGWIDVRDQVEQQVEIAARDDAMTDDFFTNVVVASEEPIGDLEDSIEAAAEQVAGTDGTYELIDEPIQIDGSEAYGFVLTRTTGGTEVAQTQWWVEHGERVYVTTFSTAKTQQEAAEPVMEEILSSWTWQD